MRQIALLSAACGLLLTGCSTVSDWMDSDEKVPLKGERVSVLSLQKELTPEKQQGEAPKIPAMWTNEFWPQAGGYSSHAMQHLTLRQDGLEKVWSADIGAGGSERLPLSARPVTADGRVYTLDTEANLCAFLMTSGKKVWCTSVIRQGEENDDPVIGGGVAYSGGRLFAVAGYDEVLSLDPAKGKILWRKTIPAPARTAPAIKDGRVFVTTLDNRLVALSAQTGEQLWQHQGISEVSGLIGGASPAVDQEFVVPAFSSGEIFALRAENGSVAWGDNIAPVLKMGGAAALADIRGLPVIDRGLVYAVSYGGRLVAIDLRTGQRVWQKDIGGGETPWVAGEGLYVLSAENELVGLHRDSGAIAWVRPLPRYEDESSREDPIVWMGPVLAGGRLILAGSHGKMIEVNPQTGAVLRDWTAGSPMAFAPVVAGGTMLLLGRDGTLTAYR